MKKFLLLGSALLFTMVSFGQLKKDPDASLRLEQYWQNKQKASLSSNPFMNLFKKREPEQNIADILSPQKETDQKNTIPVLYPDSDYVFNMPGTHAFDPTKVKGGAIFIKPQVERVVPKKEK